jgi:tripartite-type tricarboxylate transporter receptor subunit TctC
VTRAVGEKISTYLRQPVVVENRTGASSSVGSRYVAQAAPDGYTLLSMANTFLSTPTVLSSAGYDVARDFVGVSQMVRVANIVIVPASSPYRTLGDLIAAAKAQPEKLTLATAGHGSVAHIAAERFMRHVDVKFTLVPYKGNGPALIDMVGGRVATMFDQVSTSAPRIQQAQLRGLAVTGERRSAALPDIPTMAEAGVKDFIDYTFNGLAAPVKTPAAVLRRLHQAVVESMKDPELIKRFAASSVEVAPSSSPEEFTQWMREEAARYAKLAKDANFTVE